MTGQVEALEAAAAKRYVRLVLPAFASVLFAWALLVIGAYANNLAGQLGTAGWVLAHYNEPVAFGTAILRGLIGAPLFAQTGGEANFAETALNGSLWTIQIELAGSILLFTCYALFGLNRKTLLAFLFLFFSCLLCNRSPAMLHYFALLSGSFIHVFETRLRASRNKGWVCVLMGILLISVTNAPPFSAMANVWLPELMPYGPDFAKNRLLL